MADLMQKFTPPSADIKFVAEQEPWTVYRLEDGTIIRVRLILVKVTETGKTDDLGFPERQCQFQQIMDIEPTAQAKVEIEARRGKG